MLEIKSLFHSFKIQNSKLEIIIFKIMHIIKNNQCGFSLLELIIYIGILSGVMFMIVNLFVILSASSANDEARTEVQQNLQFAMQQIADEVRSGKEIVSATLPDGEKGNVLDIAAADGMITRFSVLGGILQRTEDLGLPGETSENITTDKVAVNISPEIFYRVGDTIQIIMEISYNDNGRKDYIFSQKNQTAVSIR